jgi:tetratricopeptide (TPR) repeat protein
VRPFGASTALLFLICAGAAAAPAPKTSPRAAFQQALADFGTSRSAAAREKVITLAAALKPAPAIPKEARRHFVMGGTFQKTAKTVEDYGTAIRSYEEALILAPWWGDAYYNLSVSLESAGRFDEAKAALQRYLLSKPADAGQAEDRLYAIEAKEAVASKEKAANSKNLIVPGERVGDVRVGLTPEEAVALLGAPTDRFDYDNNNGYHGVNMTWGVKPDTIYLDFYKNQPSKFVNSGQARFKTAEGVGPGMPFSEAMALLGPASKSKDFGTVAQVCYARGIALGRYAGSTKVDYVIVFSPASYDAMCPD